MRAALAVASLAALTVVAACGGTGGTNGDASGALAVERETIDGVTTVRNLSGSRWSEPATLVEELSIGVLDGDEEYLLGDVWRVSSGDGRIFVIDTQVPVVRVYDESGTYVADLGRAGQGPGEYEFPRTVGVRPDGTVLVYDARTDRITTFGPDLQVRNTWSYDGPALIGAMYLLTDGRVLVETGDRPEATGPIMLIGNFGVAELLADGSLGPRREYPSLDFEPTTFTVTVAGGGAMAMDGRQLFFPARLRSVGPDGALVAGVSSDYSFRVLGEDGTELRVERYWDPIPIPAEHLEYQARSVEGWFRQLDPEWSLDRSTLPSTKAAFVGLQADRQGRVWVMRDGNSIRRDDCEPDPQVEWRAARENPCWVSRPIVDVFDANGEYLGELRRPAGLTFRAVEIDGDRYLAAVEDEDGLVMVKRYRIVIPGE